MKITNIPTGFTAKIKEPFDVLSLGVFGGPGTGKTRFACSAPGGVGIVAMDKNTRQCVRQYQREFPDEAGKILMPDQDFAKISELSKDKDIEKLPTAVQMKIYRDLVDKIKSSAEILYKHPQIRTIVLDTGTALFNNMLFACYGRDDRIMPRDRKHVNSEYINFINSLSNKNLIIVHESSEVYENDKPTGRYKLDGFRRTGHLVDTIVELRNNRELMIKKPGMPKWECVCHQSHSNPDLEGDSVLTGEKINFYRLAMEVRPDSDPEVWA